MREALPRNRAIGARPDLALTSLAWPGCYATAAGPR
jgi:hypothetical protein